MSLSDRQFIGSSGALLRDFRSFCEVWASCEREREREGGWEVRTLVTVSLPSTSVLSPVLYGRL